MKTFAGLMLALAFAVAGCDSKPEQEKKSAYVEIDRMLDAKDFEHALPMLEEMRARRGPEPALMLRLSSAYAGNNDPAKAVLCLREAIEKHPEIGVLHLSVAQHYMALEQPAFAKDALEQARAHGAPDAPVALALGITLGQLGDLDGALREFARALEAGGDAKTIHYNQALVLSQKGQNAQARELLEQILVLDPQWAVAKRELARVLIALAPNDAATRDRAMGMLWDVKDSLKDDWRIQEIMGDGWLLQGDLDAAIAAYTEALRLGGNPKSAEDKYRTAKIRQREELQAKTPTPDKSSSATPK